MIVFVIVKAIRSKLTEQPVCFSRFSMIKAHQASPGCTYFGETFLSKPHTTSRVRGGDPVLSVIDWLQAHHFLAAGPHSSLWLDHSSLHALIMAKPYNNPLMISMAVSVFFKRYHDFHDAQTTAGYFVYNCRILFYLGRVSYFFFLIEIHIPSFLFPFRSRQRGQSFRK